MHLTDDDLNEFIAAYSAAFHEEIPLAEAREMASRVMRLYEVLAAPLPGEGIHQFDEKQNTDIS